MSKERRKHTRWRTDEDVNAYIDGDRLDLQSADISSGGMMLATDLHILPGVQVALVFRSQFEEEGQPIFLIARVMRRQAKPFIGLGLRWERAVTESEPARLIAFLRTRLRLLSPSVEVKPMARRPGRTQACYIFSNDTASVLPPSPPETPSTGGGRTGKKRKSTSSGPFTDRFAAPDILAPTDIEAVFVVKGKRQTARIIALSDRSMSIVAEYLGAARGMEMNVVFQIHGKNGPAEVICECRVLGTKLRRKEFLTHMDLTILKCDEQGEKGIFSHYVRWLHFNALRKS